MRTVSAPNPKPPSPESPIPPGPCPGGMGVAHFFGPPVGAGIFEASGQR